jgi:phospholipase C
MAPINNPSSTVADVLNGQNRCGTVRPDTSRQQARSRHRPLAGEQGRCGPGPRQPLLVISPYAKSNYVDHHQTQQGSIVRFIEDNWRLGRIDGSTDKISGSLDAMFAFRGHRLNQKLILDPVSGQPVRR